VLYCLEGGVNAADSPTTTVLEAKAFGLKGQTENIERPIVDFRYGPRRWQACIGLPDDPHKSIVGSDGGLYYNYGGGHLYSFKTRVLATLETKGQSGEIHQRLLDPRIPVVITERQVSGLTLRQQAWARAPKKEQTIDQWSDLRTDCLWATMVNSGDMQTTGRLVVQVDCGDELLLSKDRRRLLYRDNPDRIFCAMDPACSTIEPASAPPNTRLVLDHRAQISRNWANPKTPCAPRFHHILVGWSRPLAFDFLVDDDKTYRVAFGLIEGYHEKGGIRPPQIHVEGVVVRTVDLIGEYGRNIPKVFAFDAKDRDGNGRIELGVHPVQGAEDGNTILSGLWVFRAEDALSDAEILSGVGDKQALARADCDHFKARRNVLRLMFEQKTLAGDEKYSVLLTLPQGEKASEQIPESSAAAELARSISYWKEADLPYDRIIVPDDDIQAQLNSCIRNIYQAREIKDNRPAFQVGPTCYRGTWAADGPFILEAITYLGRADEVRAGLEQQVDKDQGPGGVEFSKKSGLRLWMIWRHAQLTGDWKWLEKMWPRVEREINQIIEYRRMTMDDPKQANYGLMPIGFGDGGLGGKHREYTNVYWTLAGLRAALAMAERLNKSVLSDWEAQYKDYWSYFEKARQRDKLDDDHGNVYVPVTMKGEQPQLPQRGAWAFLQSIFPGRIFEPEDELMLGTMAMLDATERQGLIYGTGWLPDGIWNYAASFYGHAHLWLGHGRKTASVLYAFANHACPLLCWREEQNLVGEPEKYCGDMPHNWASAEFIRMVRHMMILERGPELHLLEGMPTAWTQAGNRTSLKQIPTSFGRVSLSVVVSDDGGSATIRAQLPCRDRVRKVVVHLEHFDRPIRRIYCEGKDLSGTGMKVSIVEPLLVRVEFEN